MSSEALVLRHGGARGQRRTLCLVGVSIAASLGAALAFMPGLARTTVSPPTARALAAHKLTGLPLVEQAAVSRGIGSRESAFWAHRQPGGWSAATGGLTAVFADGGVVIRVGTHSVGFSLASIGRGGTLQRERTLAPRVSRSRVVYSRPGVQEWYANGPAGLEQGFRIARRPAGASTGSLTLSMALSGDLTPTLDPGRLGLTLRTASGKAMLFYTGLSATDATGRAVPAHLALHGGRVLLVVNDARARYPLTIDPTIEQRAILTASNGEGGQYVGEAVASSADGSTLVVAGPNRGPGTVYVFVRPTSGWANATETQQLTVPNNFRTDDAGAVAISPSGDTVAVGVQDGHVYVFTRPAEGWSKGVGTMASLTKSSETPRGFGESVAISGEAVVVGALTARPSARTATRESCSSTPSPRVAGRSMTAETAVLTASDGAENDYLGAAVAIDGETIVGSAPYHNPDGAVYVYARPPGGWTNNTQTAKLSTTGGSEVYLGNGRNALAISGPTIAVGASHAKVGANEGQGTVYVYSEPEGGWKDTSTETAQLTANEGQQYDYLGRAVAVYGNAIVAGASMVNSSNQQGAAFIYTKPALGWASTTEAQKITASDAANGADFGIAVAAGANTILVGAEFAAGTGKAYVFASPPAPPVAVSAAPTSVALAQATLNGTVNPSGSTVSDCHFEWGTTTGYGHSAPCATSPGAGVEAVAVSATLNGLSSGMTYHYRLVAVGPGGAAEGADEQFTTMTPPAAPAAISSAPSGVLDGQVTLNGSVNPNGSAVSDCHFDWGTTTAYGHSAPCAASPGAGAGPAVVTATLTGLAPGTTYHYRLVAAGVGGTSYGGDEQFTTLPAPTPLPLQCSGRAIVLITVVQVGKKVHLSGLALAKYAGSKVTLTISDVPKKYAKGLGGSTVVTAAGTFEANLRAPTGRLAPLTRYAATVAGKSSLGLKLGRTLKITGNTPAAGGSRVSLQYTERLGPSKHVITIARQVSCTREVVFEKVKLPANGKLTVLLPAPEGSGEVSYYRAQTPTHAGLTYSLPIAVANRG